MGLPRIQQRFAVDEMARVYQMDGGGRKMEAGKHPTDLAEKADIRDRAGTKRSYRYKGRVSGFRFDSGPVHRAVCSLEYSLRPVYQTSSCYRRAGSSSCIALASCPPSRVRSRRQEVGRGWGKRAPS